MERLDGVALRFLCDGIDTPGVGKPLFAILHNERSRDVLRRRVCQICQDPLRSAICMNQGERDGIFPLINDGLPMCDDCAGLALAQCPGLRRAADAGRLRLYRTDGWRFAPMRLGMVPESRGGNPRLNRLLAAERGPVFSGVKLLLTRFRQIDPATLAAVASTRQDDCTDAQIAPMAGALMPHSGKE